jgi:hypothetical protein
VAARDLVCLQANITQEDRYAILFETGCQFVEHLVKDATVYEIILTHPDQGFWDWWIVEFAKDEYKKLVKDSICFTDGASYEYMKRSMLRLKNLRKEFAYVFCP